MSIHPSLRAPDKTKKQRSVLKRTERLKTMLERGDWKEGEDIFGLPKIKTLRIRVKKDKAEKVETAAEGAAAPAGAGKEAKAAPAKATSGKEAAKAPAGKSAEKK
jgi:small basic protein (TIGR04137 family)